MRKTPILLLAPTSTVAIETFFLFAVFVALMNCNVVENILERCDLQLECTEGGEERNKIRLPIRSARGPQGVRGPAGMRGPRGYQGPPGPPGETTVVVKEKEKQKEQPKAAFFSALKENIIKKPGANEKVVFDEAITNVGGGYNNTSGVFTAPTAGVYVFGLSISAQGGAKKAAGRMMQNGIHVMDVWSSSYPWATSSTQAVLLLHKGDRIWIQFRPEAYLLHGYRYTTFSGFLLNTVP